MIDDKEKEVQVPEMPSHVVNAEALLDIPEQEPNEALGGKKTNPAPLALAEERKERSVINQNVADAYKQINTPVEGRPDFEKRRGYDTLRASLGIPTKEERSKYDEVQEKRQKELRQNALFAALGNIGRHVGSAFFIDKGAKAPIVSDVNVKEIEHKADVEKALYEQRKQALKDASLKLEGEVAKDYNKYLEERIAERNKNQMEALGKSISKDTSIYNDKAKQAELERLFKTKEGDKNRDFKAKENEKNRYIRKEVAQIKGSNRQNKNESYTIMPDGYGKVDISPSDAKIIVAKALKDNPELELTLKGKNTSYALNYLSQVHGESTIKKIKEVTGKDLIPLPVTAKSKPFDAIEVMREYKKNPAATEAKYFGVPEEDNMNIRK